MKNAKSTRRRFLQGAGGTMMSLPLLEATASDKELESPPMRMVATGVFYGLMPEFFVPEKTGRDYEIPRLLKPLEKHRDQFTVFSGLDHNIGGGHTGTKYFLTGIPVTHAKGYAESNISVDQKAAQFTGGTTRYPSLALGCEVNSENYLSWTRNGAQVRPVQRIDQLFNMLFRKNSKEAITRERKGLKERRSILDLVRDQAHSFERDISKGDKEKLDQYFTSVRELELKIEQSDRWLDTEKSSTDYELPNDVSNLTLREKTPYFYDLMALALQTNSTRVITLSFSELGKESGGLKGVSHGYHSLSHHGKVKEAMDELAIIETFFVSQYARFLDKLKEIKEPNGETLLDNTMALFGSGMSNGNSHSNRDLPVILAGGGFRHGEHLHFARNGRQSVPLCNLYVTMLERFGLEIEGFNTSSGNLSQLKTG